VTAFGTAHLWPRIKLPHCQPVACCFAVAAVDQEHGVQETSCLRDCFWHCMLVAEAGLAHQQPTASRCVASAADQAHVVQEPSCCLAAYTLRTCD
jgi:hypothetical protein